MTETVVAPSIGNNPLVSGGLTLPHPADFRERDFGGITSHVAKSQSPRRLCPTRFAEVVMRIASRVPGTVAA